MPIRCEDTRQAERVAYCLVQFSGSTTEERFSEQEVRFNAAMPSGRIREFCDFSPEGFETFKRVIDTNDLSTRSMDRVAKVARTIADLSRSKQVETKHLEEAASFVVGGILRDAK